MVAATIVAAFECRLPLRAGSIYTKGVDMEQSSQVLLDRTILMPSIGSMKSQCWNTP